MRNTFDRTDDMICPKCRSEFVPGIADCPDCDEPLVDALPTSDPGEHPEPVVVMTSGRPDEIALARSILTDAGIEFAVLGEGVQDLFGWGRFPVGSNVVVGPIKIMVRPDDAAAASDLLAGIARDSLASSDDTETSDELDGEVQPSSWFRWVRRAALVASVVVLAIIALEILGALIARLWLR